MTLRPAAVVGGGPSAGAGEEEVCQASASVVCVLGRLDGAAGGAGAVAVGAGAGRIAFEVAARVRVAGLSQVDI